MTLIKQSTLACLSSLLIACGGSIGHDTPTPGNGADESSSSSESSASNASSSSDGGTSVESNVLMGVFLDSPVANVHYETQSQSGATSEAGAFQYLAGEMITFSIGDLSFPEVPAKATITPLDLTGSAEVNAEAVINMVRLLLTLDVDADSDNGIQIDEQAHGAATAVDFDQSAEAFAESSAVTNLISGSGSSQTELVSASEAQAHFQSTLDGSVNNRVVASADGPGDTYELFNDAFGGEAVESPVCDPNEDSFGRRITEVMDDELETHVFAFHILRDVDGDRCIETITDRQRIEVKTYGASPADRVATEGETHTYRWKFKLDDGFQPSSSFTHIFQIKAAGGDDDGMPIVTFTPRAGSPDKLQLLHAPDGDSGADEMASAELAEFEGQWVEAYVRTHNEDNGRLEVRLTRLSDGEPLLVWSHNNIDMWRAGADINRPKWGIYRSLNNIDSLRDETVWFNDFCIAEGTNTCPSELSPVPQLPDEGDTPDFGFEADTLGEAPAGFEVEGDIVVSDEQASEGSQSVKFSHPVDGQVRMRQAFGATPTGSLKASVRIPEDVGVDTLITLYALSYNSENRAIDLIFKPDGTLRRREGSSQEDIQAYTPGAWTEIEIQWSELSTSNEFTLLVDGTEVGTFPVATAGLTPERVEFKFGQNSGAVTEQSLYVDAISIADTLPGDEGGGDETPEEPVDAPEFGFETDVVGQAPLGFEVEGDIQVSDEQAAEGDLWVNFSHPVDGQVRMRREWGAAASGSLTASVYIPADVGVDSLITVYAETYNSANRSMDILFKPDGTLRRREGSSQEDVTTYEFDTWTEVTLTWESVDTSNEFTLWIDGVEQGTFAVATPALIPERVEFKFGGNSAAITDKSLYLDAVSGF